MQEPETLETVSLIRGGAIYRLQELSRLIAPNQWNTVRRILVTVLVGWVPLVVLTAMSGSPSSLIALLKDYRVFARVFIAVPLLIAGHKVIEERFRVIVRHFVNAELLRPEDLPRFQAILATIRRLKDAWLPELALVALGCAGGILFVGNDLMLDAPWSVHTHGGMVSQSPAGWYFEVVTQTIYMVFVGLASWKWLLFVGFLWRVSRLHLQLVPCDPDQCGGLGFLGYSTTAFIPLVIAVSTAVGSVLRYQALRSVFSRGSLTMVVASWTILILVIFVGPLAVFGSKLAHLHRVGYLQYGSLSHLHAEQFHEKWVKGRQLHLGELLNAQEISALIDLASSFDRVRDTKLMPIHRTTILQVAAASAVPMLPAILIKVPLAEILKLVIRSAF